jgi:CubicO group peptidase (beta-lactamase class C family)
LLLLILTPARAAPERGEVVRGELGKHLDRSVSRIVGRHWPCSAFVARKGEILLNKGYGFMDDKRKTPMRPDAMWDCGPVTQQFTAAAVLRLEMLHKLSIDDSIAKYFPDAPHDKASIKVRHLLDHTAGIADVDRTGEGSLRSAVEQFFRVPLVRKPGVKREYSSLSYCVLAALVQQQAGRTYEEFCIEELFRPAGMEDACFIRSGGLDVTRVPQTGDKSIFAYDPRGDRGATGAIVSLPELLLWDRALRDEKILSRKAKERLHDSDKTGHAMGWLVDRSMGGTIYRTAGHAGGTAFSYLRWIERDVVVAVAMRISLDRPLDERLHPDQIATGLATIVRGAE